MCAVSAVESSPLRAEPTVCVTEPSQLQVERAALAGSPSQLREVGSAF